MDINEQLPGFVLADLFGKSLVLIDDEKQQQRQSIETKKTDKKYFGDYKNKVIVLVNDADNIFLREVDFNFLSGILNACKQSIEHIALINFDKNKADFSALKKTMQPAYLLLFGVTALQVELPFTMPDYQVQLYDSCQVLTAPSLYSLQQSKTEKAKLWKSLQKMFNLEK